MKNIALLSVLACLPLLACSSDPSVDGGAGHSGSGGSNPGSGGATGGASGGSGGAGGANTTCTLGSAAVTGVTPATCGGVFEQGTYTGYFFTMSDANDGGGSSITPECTDLGCTPKITTSMCACGKAGKVVSKEYATYWGAGVGWNLSQTATSPKCEGGTAGTVDLTGKSIAFAVDTPPTAFRIKLDTGVSTDNLCLDISGSTSKTIPVADFVNECWSSGAKTPITADQQKTVKAIQFQVPTNESADVSFSFCITNLSIQ